MHSLAGARAATLRTDGVHARLATDKKRTIYKTSLLVLTLQSISCHTYSYEKQKKKYISHYGIFRIENIISNLIYIGRSTRVFHRRTWQVGKSECRCFHKTRCFSFAITPDKCLLQNLRITKKKRLVRY